VPVHDDAAAELSPEEWLAANAPLPATGVKQWSAKLTPGQRRLLEQLAVPQPTRGIGDGRQGCRSGCVRGLGATT
jgi:hypothetical protein